MHAWGCRAEVMIYNPYIKKKLDQEPKVTSILGMPYFLKDTYFIVHHTRQGL